MSDSRGTSSEPESDEQQAWIDLSDALLAHVVSLCTKAHGKRPSHVGTGVLVEVAGNSFVVSARHVLQEAKSLFFYVDNKVVRKLSGKVALGKVEPGAVDRIDIATLRLDGQGMPPYPQVNKICLSDELMLGSQMLPRSGKHYLVTGFPSTRSRANPHAMEFKSEAWCLIGGSAEPDLYKQLALDEHTHLVLTLDRRETLRTDGSQQVFPDSHGMSGSPVWWLPDETNGLQLPKLVAIVIEHHAKLNVLVATDIHEALQQIRLLSL